MEKQRNLNNLSQMCIAIASNDRLQTQFFSSIQTLTAGLSDSTNSFLNKSITMCLHHQRPYLDFFWLLYKEVLKIDCIHRAITEF